jgi:transcriptional regulator with PAS, ATPase and Fis domain
MGRSPAWEPVLQLKWMFGILAATNIDMEAAIADKRFREDVYYRLNTLTITVPPLRERREEIPFLVQQLIQRWSLELECRVFSDRIMEAAQEYHWPGNLRELVLTGAAGFGKRQIARKYLRHITLQATPLSNAPETMRARFNCEPQQIAASRIVDQRRPKTGDASFASSPHARIKDAIRPDREKGGS